MEKEKIVNKMITKDEGERKIILDYITRFQHRVKLDDFTRDFLLFLLENKFKVGFDELAKFLESKYLFIRTDEWYKMDRGEKEMALTSLKYAFATLVQNLVIEVDFGEEYQVFDLFALTKKMLNKHKIIGELIGLTDENI